MQNDNLHTLETQIFNPRTPLEKEIVALGPWFHNLHLEDDIQTAPNHPLGDFPKFKWEQISSSVPEDITGWKVLDIGCNAGFYSFELAKRGAEVLGIDIDDHYLRQAEWASKKISMKGRIEFRKMQIYDIVNLKEEYDLILFMGVFYHLRYPLLALDIVVRKFTQLMIFQSMTMPGDDYCDVPENFEITDREVMLNPGFPRLAFIEKALSGDYTNWWAPNSAAIEAILRSSGLIIKSRPAHEIYVCTKNPNAERMDIVISELNAATRMVKGRVND